MFCTNCGKACHPNAVMCVGCGVTLSNPNQSAQVGSMQISPLDKGGLGWGVVSFVLAMLTSYIAPFVLYLLWKDEFPKRSKAILKGILACAIFSAIMVVILVVFYIIFLFGILLFAI